MSKQERCQAGHARRGGGWIIFFHPRKDNTNYRRCLNKSSVNVRNHGEWEGTDSISLCAECNRTSKA